MTPAGQDTLELVDRADPSRAHPSALVIDDAVRAAAPLVPLAHRRDAARAALAHERAASSPRAPNADTVDDLIRQFVGVLGPGLPADLASRHDAHVPGPDGSR